MASSMPRWVARMKAARVTKPEGFAFAISSKDFPRFGLTANAPTDSGHSHHALSGYRHGRVHRFYVAKRLLDAGHFVTGFDGMTKYYDVSLKEKRHAILARSNGFRAEIGMLEDTDALKRAAEAAEPEIIIHLAAQAGVRYSLENPRAYIDSNLIGSFNMLELARSLKVKHLMLASTSSIYGANEKIPFAESDKADEPMTLYAATKNPWN